DKISRVALPPLDPATGKRPYEIDTRPPKYLSGAGGLYSTALDYARFCQFLLNGGELDGVRLVSRKTVEYMTTDQLPPGIQINTFNSPAINLTPGGGQSFGLGVAVRTEVGRAGFTGSVGDFSWVGASGTYFWVDPKERLFVVLMMQSARRDS